MSFTGVLVNTGTVLVGSLLGLLLKKGIPERVSSAVMIGLGMFTVYLGIDGALGAENALIVVAALVLGAIVGTLLDIDGAITRLGQWAEAKFQRSEGGTVSLSEGFMTASILFCVGAMTVNGAIEAGVKGENSLFFTKAIMDLFSSIMLTAGLGLGVMLSAVFVLVFQGLLVLLAGWIAPALTPFAIAEMTAAGSLIMIGLGTNLMGATKIKVADYLPAIVFAPVICWIVNLF